MTLSYDPKIAAEFLLQKQTELFILLPVTNSHSTRFFAKSIQYITPLKHPTNIKFRHGDILGVLSIESGNIIS